MDTSALAITEGPLWHHKRLRVVCEFDSLSQNTCWWKVNVT